MSISTDLIEDKLNNYAAKILSGSAKTDELALGELNFYAALRRVVNGQGTMQDLGLMDAINDVLRAQGLIGDDVVFYR